jgi:hypothetical protein
MLEIEIAETVHANEKPQNGDINKSKITGKTTKSWVGNVRPENGSRPNIPQYLFDIMLN